jgi:cytochrome c oxidase cbb3-type subunit 3
MSRNPVIVSVGKATFMTTCASCHKESMRGVDEGGIGPNLIDRTWLHGGQPTSILTTVEKGVLVKGMPSWGPLLGGKKVSEVVAFVLSRHDSGEPEMAALPTAGK